MMSLKRPPHPPWLSICRLQVRGYNAKYCLVLQHPIVDSCSRIVAPVVPATGYEPTILSPRVFMGGVAYRAILLEMTGSSLRTLGRVVETARLDDEDAVLAGLDAIFRGYPVGLPVH